MAQTVAAIENELGPIVLAVFNAGNYFPTRGERLDVDELPPVLRRQLFGVINGLVPAVERMRARGSAISCCRLR